MLVCRGATQSTPLVKELKPLLKPRISACQGWAGSGAAAVAAIDRLQEQQNGSVAVYSRPLCVIVHKLHGGVRRRGWERRRFVDISFVDSALECWAYAAFSIRNRMCRKHQLDPHVHRGIRASEESGRVAHVEDNEPLPIVLVPVEIGAVVLRPEGLEHPDCFWGLAGDDGAGVGERLGSGALTPDDATVAVQERTNPPEGETDAAAVKGEFCG